MKKLAMILSVVLAASAAQCADKAVAAAMANAGQFPAVAGRVSRAGVPVVATVLQAGWALVLLWTASFETILLYAGVGLAIFSMLTIAAVFVLGCFLRCFVIAKGWKLRKTLEGRRVSDR